MAIKKFTFYLDEDIKKKLKDIADGRSLTTMIHRACIDYIGKDQQRNVKS